MDLKQQNYPFYFVPKWLQFNRVSINLRSESLIQQNKD